MKRAESAVALTAVLVAALCADRVALAQTAEPPRPGAPMAPAPSSAVPLTPEAAPSAGAPASNQGAASECYPPCRDGYFCHQSQCVSQCNPPCPSGQTCVGGRRCESVGVGAPPGGITEPPLPPPPSKPFADRSFVMLGFHYGFPGESEVDPQPYDLGSTFGANLRLDVPIERYLVLGPLFQFGSWIADFDPNHHNYYIDLDFYIRARLPITLKSTNLQFWAGVPVGVTLDVLGSPPTGVDTAGLGANVGVLAGGALEITPKLGVFTEFGWMMHKITHDAEPTVYLRLSQWVWNVGFAFRE